MTKDEVDKLRASHAALAAANVALAKENAALRARLDALLGMAADQNQQLGVLTAMMRRKLSLPPAPPSRDPDEDPPPAGGAGAGGSVGLDGDAGKPRRRGRAKGQTRKRSGRAALPPHLEVVDERHEPTLCGHCGSDKLLARDVEVVEKLDVVPMHLRRRRITRVVRQCSCCRRTTTAPMPPMPCPRSGTTSAFLAWLIVQKFVLLVPLDRTRRHLASMGVDLSMGTLVRLVERAADLLGPIDGAHWKALKAGDWLALDGTGLKTLVEGMPRAWLGNLDVFNREALTVYQFSMTKHGDGLASRLEGFEGAVVCDAESRHNELLGGGRRREANCNAHPRRKFRDAEAAQPVLAAEAGRFLSRMYAVERQARRKGLTGDDLRTLRQGVTGPVVREFRRWLQRVEPTLLPSDPLGKAVRYYLRHFEGLTRFVDDPDLPIDNNRSERAFQSHAKLRFNSLFAGSPEGAHRWATILGVVTTAQRHGLDVLAYLTWALDRRGTWKRRYGLAASDLTPGAYKQMLEQREECAAAG